MNCLSEVQGERIDWWFVEVFVLYRIPKERCNPATVT